MTAWLQTWSDTEDKPKGCKWFGQTICPRELHIKDGRIVQAPVRELDAVHGKRTLHENVTVQSETSLEGIKGRVADLTVTVQPGEYRSFTLKLAADADHHTSLTYDPYKRCIRDRLWGFPIPILLAFLLNRIESKKIKQKTAYEIE